MLRLYDKSLRPFFLYVANLISVWPEKHWNGTVFKSKCVSCWYLLIPNKGAFCDTCCGSVLVHTVQIGFSLKSELLVQN